MVEVRTPPRVVGVGANLESQITLAGLMRAGVPLAGLVTLPPGRHPDVSDYVDLHELARRHGVPTIDTTDINSADTLHAINKLRPDYLFVFGWNRLFGKELLNLPRALTVGSHPTALPEGRGRAPIPWTILLGCQRSAITLYRMTPEADTGEILVQREFEVPPRCYAMELYQRAAEQMRDAYVQLWYEILGDRVRAQPQEGSESRPISARARRGPSDGHLDFHRPAAELERLIRAVSEPYPGAYGYYGERRIHIWRASTEQVPRHVGTPGQVLVNEGHRILVHAGDEGLWLHQFSELGHAIDPTEFRVGQHFGYNAEDEIFSLRRELAALRATLPHLTVNDD